MNETEKLSRIGRRRGFFSQSCESYGGVAGFYTYGPEGAELKRNIEDLWRERFNRKEGNREIEAPTIMPEVVFEASGHLDGFDDMIIECPECDISHRADHLVEDNTEIEEAESFSLEKVEEIIEENDLKCPSCGNGLSGVEVTDFNLMFETSIGPGSSQVGYMRPETAQGIFVEFPRFKEYARNQLPFGITQIGKAYRNEISPRKNLVRVREFTQAELEHFIDPEENEPRLEKVKDVKVELYPIGEQEDRDGELISTTIGEAVEEEIIESDWVAYYLGVAKKWFQRIGLDMNRFRFRQHLEGERAHYATDCWDAEAEIDGDWIEITGFAYRGCYDLKKHEEYSGEDYKIFKEFDEPKKVEKNIVEPDMGYIGPEYGDKAGKIVDQLETLAEESPEAFDENKVELEVGDETITLPVEKTGFETVVEEKSGERITPHVVEPSFGIGRIVYSVLSHSLKTDTVDDEERTVMQFNPEVSPTTVAVFPLMDKDGLGTKAKEASSSLREAGLSVSYDDSGAIGRRYRRQDEIGTPYCVTVDHETLEDNTVTVRERDSTNQKRVPLKSLESTIEKLEKGELSFEDLSNK